MEAGSIQDFKYLYASNTNVSNFVSVKLSGNNNYHVWKSQMLCLLDTNNMGGIVDASFDSPRCSSVNTMRQYDSLARGWILGSVGEDLLAVVHNLGSAKVVWEKLKSICDPTICFPEEKEDTNVGSAEIMTIDEGANSRRIKTVEEGSDSIHIRMDEDTQKIEKMRYGRMLILAIIKGDWSKAKDILKDHKYLATEVISDDGSTILHVAVGTGHSDILKKLIGYINDEQVLKMRESDGSTALHIAAIIGNKDAVELLVKKNPKLLLIKDHNGDGPAHKAYENMQFDTIKYLMLHLMRYLINMAMQSSLKEDLISSVENNIYPDDEIRVCIILNAIFAKEYGFASALVQTSPKCALKSEDVLMAIAKTFPSGLDSGETLLYPSLDDNWEMLRKMLLKLTCDTVSFFAFPALIIYVFISNSKGRCISIGRQLILVVRTTVQAMIGSVFAFISLPILLICAIFNLLYLFWWKVGNILAFPPIKKIENKIKERHEAKAFLELVCDEIDKLDYIGTHHHYYTKAIIEAARQNAYNVVDEILFRSPEAIKSTDKDGFDIFQLAIIHRSEKIYCLICNFRERMNRYRTFVDSSKNNILHLAGRLAPSSVVNKRRGAALQLQQELQWHEEVKTLVNPTYISSENESNETPDMVFTKEHKNLVKEAEQWMKTTAESCSITAALIATIVFAAAITVPGGSNQEKGTPLFRKEIAFIIFAIADAISLFASTMALLVFLSILTARFSEKDFLVSLPMRLLIGLFSLLLSTAAMMVSFSATLFLVFCDKKPWMLAPICGLAFIPVASFVGLQFPLMLDLFSSTYLPMIDKETKIIRFNPGDIQLRYGN